MLETSPHVEFMAIRKICSWGMQHDGILGLVPHLRSYSKSLPTNHLCKLVSSLVW